MNSTVKTLFLWMAIFGVVILLWNTFQGGKAAQKDLTYSDFMTAVQQGKVAEVTIRGKQLTGKYKGDGLGGGQELKTTLLDNDPDLVKQLQSAKVRISAFKAPMSRSIPSGSIPCATFRASSARFSSTRRSGASSAPRFSSICRASA